MIVGHLIALDVGPGLQLELEGLSIKELQRWCCAKLLGVEASRVAGCWWLMVGGWDLGVGCEIRGADE